IDQVVPVLISRGKGVDHFGAEDGIERGAGQNQLIGGEVAGGEIVLRTGLIVQAAIVLVGIAEREGVLVVEAMIQATVVAPIEVRSRNSGRGLHIKSVLLEYVQFPQRIRIDRDVGVLALALQGEKDEGFVLFDRSANRSSELLPAVGGFL